MDEPYRVELNPHVPGYTYEREIVVMLMNRELGVFNADAVPIEFVEWVMRQANGALSEPVVGAA